MTARLIAAREGVHAVVRMYMPMHQSFTAEGTNQLDKALAELEAAAVANAAPPVPAVPPIAATPAPDLVKLNEPVVGVDGISPPGPPDVAPLPSAAEEIAASKAVTDPPTEKPKKKGE